ncbi:MAG: O-antigen ligase family protein [Candidatus Cybelea sp.]
MTTITPSQFGPRAALVALVPLALATTVLLVKGSNLVAVGTLALLIAPLALYVALRWPLDAIFGLYVVLVPFDNLLSTGSFGTLTKILGMAGGAFLLLWLSRRGLITFSSKPVRVLWLLALWMLASTLWALDQKPAFQLMTTFAGLMLLYAVLTMVPLSPRQFRSLLFLVVLGGLCAAAYGARAFYHDPSLSKNIDERLVVHVGQYNIDPNHFADALLFPTAIVMMWFLRTRRLLAQIACVGGLALLITAIVLSGSREALTALGLMAVYYLWRSRYRLKLGVAMAGVVALVAAVQTSIFARFATALQTGGSGRTSVWAVALEAAKHRPLQGYGIGNFPEAFNLFYLQVHQPYPFGFDGPAHNLVLHYLVEIGIVGLFLIGWFIWSQFRSLSKIDPASEWYDYRLMMEASLLALIGVSMAIDLFQYKYAWLVFSMVALLRTVALGPCQSPAMRSASPAIIPSRSARPWTRALPLSPSSRSAFLSRSET